MGKPGPHRGAGQNRRPHLYRDRSGGRFAQHIAQDTSGPHGVCPLHRPPAFPDVLPGSRIARGATRGKVYAITFAEAGTPVFAGIIAGLAASVLASRAVQTVLYGTRAVDPPVILIVTGLFLLSATAAAFLPARRAASVEPMEALRSE